MQASGIPYKFTTPWAADAAAGYITTAIPATTSGAAASQQLGFPPATAAPAGSGGTPPNIADMNGGLYYATAWAQWQQAGSPVVYDATFSAAIGGYPKGARLVSAASPGVQWISLVDNNTSDPDTSGANWTSLQAQANTWTGANAFSEPLVVAAAAGSTEAVNLGQFGGELGTNGYVKLPNGFIMQWGVASTNSNVFFPVVFPNACFGVTTGVTAYDGYNANTVQTYGVATNGFSCFGGNPSSGTGTVAFYWQALGY